MWRERRKLVEMWREGRAAALATLVAVEGSSYRKPGARLMVTTDGSYVGSISGGCLESEVVRRARWLVRDGACMQRYSTALDDTTNIPYGLGCGGSVEVLLEPAETPEFERLMGALARSLEGEASDVFTQLPSAGRALRREVRSLGADAPALADEADLHHERIEPPQRLFVFGAGDDAQPVVSLAAVLGWRVVVVDGRAQWARPERFPEAERVVVEPAGVPLGLSLRTGDFAVVMTHSFEQDRDWLQMLLPAELEYVGLLGARHRSALLAGELAERLRWPVERVCDRLRAPVGLDLGGDGAEAIALSIVAEMQACAARRPVLSRRLTTEAVADAVASVGSTRQYEQCAV